MTDPHPTSVDTRLSPGKGARWTGRILAGLVFLMMGVGAVGVLLFAPQVAQKGMADMGFPSHLAMPISILEVAFAVLFLLRPTAVLGGLLLTAYLGGAAAAHIRVGEYPQVAGPVIFGVIIWISLLLREPRLRALLPFRR